MVQLVNKMHSELINRDSKGKIRVVEINCEWDDTEHAFLLTRTTYQYGGKRTPQPTIKIEKGKAKRSVTQQATLEFNSHVNKYKDKGYKELENSIDSYSVSDLDDILPEHTTDANGFKKHMLAKQSEKVASSTFERVTYWWASRKIDGRPL